MVVYGGRRSSKSVSVSQLLVRRALENPGRKIVVMRKVAATLRLSVWPRVKAALEEAGVLSMCDINKSDRTIELPNTSMFIFVGADDPEKLKSLEGATDFWLEELPEFDEMDLDTVDAGLSADVWPVCQIWMTFNPVPIIEGVVQWFVQRFVRAVEHELSVPAISGDICVLRTWYKDNAFCPPATVKLLENYAACNPELYKLWALGEFTHLEGVIFKNWDIVDSVPTEGGVHELGYGLDFGFSVDPSALVRGWGRGMNTEQPEIWLLEEIYETELNNQQLGARMRQIGVPATSLIAADAGEPKSIDELMFMGFNVQGATWGKADVRAGLMQMQAMKVHLVRGSTNLIKEWSTYCWKKDRNGKALPAPVDAYNHGIDAARYLVTRPIAAPFETMAIRHKPVMAGIRGRQF
jgi:phage terminase large subunit